MLRSNHGRSNPLRREVEERLLAQLHADGFEQHPSPLAHFGWSPGVQFFEYDLVRKPNSSSLDLLDVFIDVKRMSVYLDFVLLEGSFDDDPISKIVANYDIKTATSVSYDNIRFRFCRPNSWLPFGRIYRVRGRSDEKIAQNSKRLIGEIIKDLNSLPQFLEKNEKKRHLVNQHGA